MLISMLLAAAFVLATLSIVRLPAVPELSQLTPMVDLIVRIIQPEIRRSVEAEEVPPEVTPVEETAETPSAAPPLESQSAAAAAPPDVGGIDWDATREAAVEEYLSRSQPRWSFDPRVDERRREGALRYRPRTTPGPRPIWENVEPDQLGRTVLRSGDCYKVIDDPNVSSQYAFQTFGQYIAICTWQPRAARELPWVETIRERYYYLKYPDGEGPEEPSE